MSERIMEMPISQVLVMCLGVEIMAFVVGFLLGRGNRPK